MSIDVTLDDKLLYPSEYIGAADLKGRDVTLTISRVELADLRLVGGATKRKPVVHFDKTEKKLVLNKTNAALVASQHGGKCEGWTGKKITLYPTTTKCKGQTVPCVRVREGNQQQEQA